jgi:hypothetical protein
MPDRPRKVRLQSVQCVLNREPASVAIPPLAEKWQSRTRGSRTLAANATTAEMLSALL